MSTRGEIEYELWTVCGTVKLKVYYEVQEVAGSFGIGNISIEPIDPDAPDFAYNLDQEMEDIVQQCFQDYMSQKKEKDEVEVPNPVPGRKDYPKAHEDYDFSLN